MPRAYEAMRDKFMGQGMSDSAAKGKAARIYNARRKPGQKPVTGHHRGGKTGYRQAFTLGKRY